MNELFINNGNDANSIPQFTEQAQQYSLADTGCSARAFFFGGYDRDWRP